MEVELFKDIRGSQRASSQEGSSSRVLKGEFNRMSVILYDHTGGGEIQLGAIQGPLGCLDTTVSHQVDGTLAGSSAVWEGPGPDARALGGVVVVGERGVNRGFLNRQVIRSSIRIETIDE